jgi:hypothetical protein
MELVLSFSYWEHFKVAKPTSLLWAYLLGNLSKYFLNFIARMQKSKGKHIKNVGFYLMKIIKNYKK